MPGFPSLRSPELSELHDRLSKFDACPGYSWKTHCLLLAPLAAVVLLTGLTLSWWGEPVLLAYTAIRPEYPLVTRMMRLLSAWGSPVLYAAYAALLVRGLWGFAAEAKTPAAALPAGQGPTPAEDILLALRYIVFSLLITVFVTQCIKYGLGMPRPGFPWPPQPLAFRFSYNSFPSGHTTEIVASALPLAFRFHNKPARVALALLVALVGYSRIWLSRHHPVDIVAGMVLGSLAARLICVCSRDERN